MRKVNAVISLLISVLLLDHALFKGAWGIETLTSILKMNRK